MTDWSKWTEVGIIAADSFCWVSGCVFLLCKRRSFLSRQEDASPGGETVARVANYLLSFCCGAKLSDKLLAPVLSERKDGSSSDKLLALVLLQNDGSFSLNELLAALTRAMETNVPDIYAA